MTENNTTDIIVIGAGPAGLFTAFEAGMLGFKCHIIDALEFIGGQCSALYPEKPIYDVPAYPSILAEDLVQNLHKQAAPFEPVYHLGQQVIKLEKDGDYWCVTTSLDKVIQAKVIIIAAGCGAFGPNRPPLENLEEYEGKSVLYMVGKREDMRDKNLVIAGGGDSAVDWVLSLADIAKSIKLVHRRPKFRCSPDSQSKIMQLADAGKVELVVPYQLDSLKGENGDLSSVVVKTLDGNKKELEADILLPFYGLAMDLGPIINWGLNLDNKHIKVDPLTLATNESGIYAIGDIATYPKKLKLILTGFHESAMACHSAREYIFPDKQFHFEYSTTKGVA